MGRETDANSEQGLNLITGQIVDSAIRVHSALGPGLLESAYEVCLAHELHKRGLPYQRQVSLPVEYDGLSLDAGYRLDMLIDDEVIVELKAVEKLSDLHRSQIMTYLRLSRKSVGLLLNFNVRHMRDGIHRIRM